MCELTLLERQKIQKLRSLLKREGPQPSKEAERFSSQPAESARTQHAATKK